MIYRNALESIIQSFSEMKYAHKLIVVGIILIILIWVYSLYKGYGTNKKYTWEDYKYYLNPIQGKSRKVSKDSSGEIECRQILEEIFKRPFPKIRPDFMKNPITNRNLELDCYNEELGIALEYDGAQHAHYSPFFHKEYKDFEKQQIRDKIKEDLCKKHGIFLIRVPHHIQNRRGYIIRKLKEYKNTLN